jgi:peptidoglycan/LPS O-acetylase OafA/YrhL
VRKGAAGYLRDRALRLGLPFAIAASVIAPIAYYPAYLQSGGTGGWAGFWQVWTTPGVLLAGPAWFLWVLLAFDVVIAGLYRVVPAWGTALGGLIGRMRRPVAAFGVLFAASALAYVALELPLGGLNWWTWGPFTVQTARLLYYFTYFVFGVGIGACGLERTVFAPDGALARQWKRWLNIAGFAFAAAMVAIIAAFTVKPLTLPVHLGADLGFALSSAASSFAALALFLRFARGRSPVFAALAPCAYGMYLVHYPIASQLQYAMLGAPLPGLVKGTIVFAAAVALSWGLVALLRRIPGVARVI